jgi:hypothetical protein
MEMQSDLDHGVERPAIRDGLEFVLAAAGESGDLVGAAFDFAGVHARPQVKALFACLSDDAPRAAHVLGGPVKRG